MADGYGEFVQRELDDQRTAKASLEQRGMAVITSSGVVLTLLFGLAAVAESNSRFNIADAARPWLYASGGFFGGAAILALVTSVPLRYKAPKPEALVRQVREAWTEPEATQRVALTRVGMIASYRRRNGFKAWVLMFAMAAQVVAILLLAVAIKLVIEHA
jgi:hypothetical protein